MNEMDMFYEIIKNDMTVTLATASDSCVTMRSVSPVFYKTERYIARSFQVPLMKA